VLYIFIELIIFSWEGDIHMKKLAVLVVLVSMIALSCTGTFQLTRQVYDFQTKPADKWVDEVLFLAFVIVPVYGVATFVDAVVFNSIEFWTGQNPMRASLDNNNNVVAQNGKDQLIMKYDPASKDIQVSPTQTGKSFVLSKTANGVVAKDREGKVLFTSVEDSQGGITVLDGNNMTIRHFSREDVQKERAEFFTR
jgi:hypothetical protein